MLQILSRSFDGLLILTQAEVVQLNFTWTRQFNHKIYYLYFLVTVSRRDKLETSANLIHCSEI